MTPTPRLLPRALGLTVLALAWMAVDFDAGLNPYDEGILCYGATRILAGDVLYSDLFSLHGPAQHYLLAVLFSFFGPSLILERLVSLIARAAISGSVYLWAASLSGPLRALPAWALVTVWMRPSAGQPNPPAMALLLGSWICLLGVLPVSTRWRSGLAGLLGGLGTLFRHDLGLVTLAIQAGWVFSAGREAPPPSESSPPPHRARAARQLFIGAGAVLLPAILLLLFLAGPAPLYEQLVRFPSVDYPRLRSLPFPWAPPAASASLTAWSLWLQFLFPLLIAVWAATLAIVGRDRADRQRLMLAALLPAAYALQLTVRADVWHLMPGMTAAAVSMAVVSSELARRGHRVAGLLPLLLSGLVLLQPLGAKIGFARYLAAEGPLGKSKLPRASGIRLLPDRLAYEECLLALRELVPPGERIYSGNRRHDRLVRGDPLVYFLTERESGVRDWYLHPGLTTRPEIQSRMVGDLESARIGFALLFDDDSQEPNEASTEAGSRTLDLYLAREFRQLRAFGPYSIWTRKSP